MEEASGGLYCCGSGCGYASALMMTGEESLPENVKAVVSDCAFTDAYTMFGEKMKEWFHLPAFPLLDTANLMLQLRGGYNLKDASALEAVKKSKTPTLFIHGDQDEMRPGRVFWDGREVFETTGNFVN